MILAVISMLLAAGIELARKASIAEYGYVQQELADKVFNASELSVFAQVPQYTFIGASEVFASITGMSKYYRGDSHSCLGDILGKRTYGCI